MYECVVEYLLMYHNMIKRYCNSTLEELLDVAEKPKPNGKGGKSGGWFGGNGNSTRPQLDLVRALKMGFELSLAVSYLHNEALPGHVVLHRDIKPSNVSICLKEEDFSRKFYTYLTLSLSLSLYPTY
jgi:serine/threonine protein kinase